MQATEVARERVVTDSVSSADGTTIGYRRLGHGPGLVVLHGAMESAASHLELAEALADDLTVYLPDRRGRGTSGPYGIGYGVTKEVEDLAALLDRTGARNVLGVSSGALISLQAALTLPEIHKAVIFEPPLNVNGSVSTAFLPRYDLEIATGNVAGALVTGMLATQMGPPIFARIPRWLLETLTKLMLAGEDRRATAADVTMRALAPTLHYDSQLVIETKDTLERYRTIGAHVLLLGGSRSPAYLKTAVDALARVLPHVRRVELAGAGHGAAGNRNRGGTPALVASEVRRFLA
jgi:pimeloyl-ACP methyl ester carboxylesterase